MLPLLPPPPATAKQLGHGSPAGHKTQTNFRPEMSPGTDLSATTLVQSTGIHISKPQPRPDLQFWGKVFTMDSGEEPPSPVWAKDGGVSGTYLGCPATATSSHLPRSFFRSFYSTLKTSNFALGMSRMKCHLPTKRDRRESHASHYIPIL